MYNGDEKIICNGEYTPYTMLDFWKWAYSNIRYNMQRGTFADYLVRCALETGGFATRPEIGTGFEPYDLEGPMIASTGKPSRIEVKSAATLQAWGMSSRIAFSIAPARVAQDGDVKHNSPQQRNNDLYVFALYTATESSANTLDLYWWRFYVLPTYIINGDSRLSKQKTISLKSIERHCKQLEFTELYDAIISACDSIPKL